MNCWFNTMCLFQDGEITPLDKPPEVTEDILKRTVALRGKASYKFTSFPESVEDPTLNNAYSDFFFR